MSYLLAQILICLLAAWLIGALMGWFFRGGCKKKIRDIENEWSAKYDTDRAIWQGKIDAAEKHVQRSLHRNNSEWDARLRDAESTWEGKVQGLVGNYDAEITNLNRDREALEDKLLKAQEEARRAKEQLEKMEHQWHIRLQDVESTWESKVQSIKSDYDTKTGDSTHQLQLLKDKLATTEKELAHAHKKVEDVTKSYEDKLQTVRENYESKIDDNNQQLQALKDELKQTEEELTAVNDEWSMKLKDVESSYVSKIEATKNDNQEIDRLKEALKKSEAKLKEAETKLTKLDSEWSVKLKDRESLWQGKIESIKSDFEKKSPDESQLKELKAKLEESESRLAKIDDEWSMKLKDVESSYVSKIEATKNDNQEIDRLKEALKKSEAKLKEAESKLTKLDSEWSVKLKDTESLWQGKIESIKSDFEKKSPDEIGKLEGLKLELEDTKAELNETKAELKRANDQWSIRLKDKESAWQEKIESIKSTCDTKLSSSEEELKALKIMLEKSEADAKSTSEKLAQKDDEWSLKLKDVEASWKSKIEALESDYDSKKSDNDKKLKALELELKDTKSQLQSSDEYKVKLEKLEAKTKDSDKKLKELELDLKNAQIEAKKAKEELEASNDTWSKKLKSVDSSWESKIQTIIGDYDSKISAVDKERATLEADLNATKAQADAAREEMLKSDGELFGALGHIEDSYEVEALEGIGAGYGKKFRALGVSTTDEFAKRFLSNEKEASKASKETGIDKEAILAWASMADLLSLPGINPDDAELLQAVGVNSKEELTKQDAKALHDKMVAYNSKHKIAPDVPSTALLLKLTKLPDNKAIAEAVKVTKGDGIHQRDSYDVEEIEGIGAGYGKKFRSLGVSTTAQFADKFLNNDGAVEKAAKETGIEVNAIKAWASMADLMRLPGVDGQYAEIMQAVGVSSVEELRKFDANILHEKMVSYNKTNPIVPEVPSAEFLSTWAKATVGKDDNSLESSDEKSKNQHLNECYDIEEVEGIGPGYAKRLRKLGINTTCDLADNYLRDNKATKKASKKMGVDFDALRAWASMADLMRLPGVDGQYAEIMQTVGLDSRKELTHISLNHLHELMVEFNAKNPIVPEVPTMDMLVAWSTAAKKQK